MSVTCDRILQWVDDLSVAEKTVIRD